MAEGARVLALVEQRAAAEPAGAAGDLEAAEDAVADRDARDGVAGGDDLADELVADREAGLDLHAPVVDVQVGAADPGRAHADDRVVRREQLGIGLLDELDLLWTLEGDGLHAAGRYRPFFASACFFGALRLVRPRRARRSASFTYSASDAVKPSASTSMSAQLVEVADQAEARHAVVGHDGDRGGAVAGEERERVDLLELRGRAGRAAAAGRGCS